MPLDFIHHTFIRPGLADPDCGTGGCPPGHTITMISNAFSYTVHSSRFGGSRLWYRRFVPRVIPSHVNSFFIVDKPIMMQLFLQDKET